MRINFLFYCGLLVLILVVFCVVSSSLRFGQISPLAFFLKKARGEIWPKEETTQKTTTMRTKSSQ